MTYFGKLVGSAHLDDLRRGSDVRVMVATFRSNDHCLAQPGTATKMVWKPEPKKVDYSHLAAKTMMEAGWPFSLDDVVDGSVTIRFTTPTGGEEVRVNEPVRCVLPVPCKPKKAVAVRKYEVTPEPSTKYRGTGSLSRASRKRHEKSAVPRHTCAKDARCGKVGSGGKGSKK